MGNATTNPSYFLRLAGRSLVRIRSLSGTGSVHIIGKCALDSIAFSARAKPSLTCCASPQKTRIEFAQAGANGRSLGRRNPVGGGTASSSAVLRSPLAETPPLTELSSNRRPFVRPCLVTIRWRLKQTIDGLAQPGGFHLDL